MNQSLSQLKAKCQQLGLTVRRLGNRDAKEDCTSVLRAHFLFQDFPNGCPYDEFQPMLAYPYWQLRLHEREAIWKDNNYWVAQEKFNGCRIIIHFTKGIGTFAHSRALSVKTYRRQPLEDHLLFGDYVPDFTAVIDAEAIVEKPIDTRPYTARGEVTKSSLQSTSAILQLEAGAAKRLQTEQNAPLTIKVFDITNWDGKDLKYKKLCERLSYIPDFQAAISKTPLERWFQFPPITFHYKAAYFDKITTNGGEGIVLKHLNSTYEASTSRKRNSWVKVKRSQEFDAYVSGFEPGRPNTRWEDKVACLHFSITTEAGPHLIAKVSNLPWEIRKAVSIRDPETRKVTLREDTYGKVAHLTGYEIAARSHRLSHPKIVRWCDRMLIKDQCRYSLADIKTARPTLRIVNDEQTSDQRY
jgi:hypothetical protein